MRPAVVAAPRRRGRPGRGGGLVVPAARPRPPPARAPRGHRGRRLPRARRRPAAAATRRGRRQCQRAVQLQRLPARLRAEPARLRLQGQRHAERRTPASNMPPANAYWGLFWSDGSPVTWTYSSEGVGGLNVPDGGCVAFAWQDGGDQDCPAPAPVHRKPEPRRRARSRPRRPNGSGGDGRPAAVGVGGNGGAASGSGGRRRRSADDARPPGREPAGEDGSSRPSTRATDRRRPSATGTKASASADERHRLGRQTPPSGLAGCQRVPRRSDSAFDAGGRRAACLCGSPIGVVVAVRRRGRWSPWWRRRAGAP